MGDSLKHIPLRSLGEEVSSINKEAAINPGAVVGKLRGLASVGKLKSMARGAGRLPMGAAEQAHKAVDIVAKPWKSLPAGWRHMAPGYSSAHAGNLRVGLSQKLGLLKGEEVEAAKQLLRQQGKDISELPMFLEAAGKLPSSQQLLRTSREAAAAAKAGREVQRPGLLSRVFGEGGQTHLLEGGRPLSEVYRSPRALAEELSRRGWTGAGALTKYVPLGQKSMIAGFGSSAVPGMVRAAQGPAVGPTGEGGPWERGLGELGGTAGWIAGAPLGFLGGTGLWLGGERAGSGLGRIIDRLRSGADVSTALTAPSPTEAAEQMSEVARHYG